MRDYISTIDPVIGRRTKRAINYGGVSAMTSGTGRKTLASRRRESQEAIQAAKRVVEEGVVADDPALAELVGKINQTHTARLACCRKGMEHALVAGGLLIEAKEISKDKFGHGHWLPWVKKNCSFGVRTAQLYMQLHGFVSQMPDLKSRVLEENLDDAVQFLKDMRDRRMTKQELATDAMGSSMNNGLYAAAEVLNQMKLRLGEGEWEKYLEELDENQVIVVRYLIDKPSLPMPTFLPNRFKARDEDGNEELILIDEEGNEIG
jgi:hypothetical protein